MIPTVTIMEGDVLARLRELPAQSVQMCVTSPPYWGLRDYKLPPSTWPSGWVGCHGLEPSLELFVAHEVAIFREVRRVLRKDGTCWVNLGDSYASAAGGYNAEGSMGATCNKRISKKTMAAVIKASSRTPPAGLKPKDLCGVPWRVAFALQADGWFLRQDIIWAKPNPMPESVRDRCTKAHEYLFLLSKSGKYYFDQEAIKEGASYNTHARRSRAAMDHKSAPNGERNGIRPYKVPDGWDTTKGEGGHGSIHKRGRDKGSWKGSEFQNGKTAEHQLGRSQTAESRKLAAAGSGTKNNDSFEEAMCLVTEDRNKRSVWTVASHPFKEAHFATFPPDLIKPCILAGSCAGDVVLDPFFGSGTTGMVSLELGRSCIGIELNADYIAMARRRCHVTPGLAL